MSGTNNSEPAMYSVAAFCETHSISRALLYKLLKAGTGPRICKIGNRTLVSREAAQQWREEHCASCSGAKR